MYAVIHMCAAAVLAPDCCVAHATTTSYHTCSAAVSSAAGVGLYSVNTHTAHAMNYTTVHPANCCAWNRAYEMRWISYNIFQKCTYMFHRHNKIMLHTIRRSKHSYGVAWLSTSVVRGASITPPVVNAAAPAAATAYDDGLRKILSQILDDIKEAGTWKKEFNITTKQAAEIGTVLVWWWSVCISYVQHRAYHVYTVQVLRARPRQYSTFVR